MLSDIGFNESLLEDRSRLRRCYGVGRRLAGNCTGNQLSVLQLVRLSGNHLLAHSILMVKVEGVGGIRGMEADLTRRRVFCETRRMPSLQA
jgi:hypothetical protein